MPYETLIEADALAMRLGDSRWCIVDCRAVLGEPDAGRRMYDSNHIPGAVHEDLERDLSGPIRPGITGRHPLPDPDRLAETLGGWGVDDSTQLVAYDAGSRAFAARPWWLARWRGHPAVAGLNGGFDAWSRAGSPTSREPSGARDSAHGREPSAARDSAHGRAAARDSADGKEPPSRPARRFQRRASLTRTVDAAALLAGE